MEEAGKQGERLGEAMQAVLAETHTLHLKLLRQLLKLFAVQQIWSKVVETSDSLAGKLEAVFDKERLRSDLRYAHCLVQGARARAKLASSLTGQDAAIERETAHRASRKALMVYATVLGSSHWFVGQLKSELQALAPAK